MNKLSKKQKNILIDYIKDGYFDYYDINDFRSYDLLIDKFNNESILLSQLRKANDYELLYDDYKRIKNDLLFKDTKDDKIRYILNYK